MKRVEYLLFFSAALLFFNSGALSPVKAGEGTYMDRNGNGAARLVIIGASYAKGWTPGTLAGHRVVTKGVSGEQAHEMLARFETDVIALSPAAVIIWGFINGFHRTPPSGWDGQMKTIRSSFEAMVARAREHGIEPILATEVTIRGPRSLKNDVMTLAGRLLGKKSYQDLINEQVQATNEWLREYAAREGLQLLDLQPLVSDGRGVRMKMYATDDGSHISAMAYDRFTDYAENTLKLVPE
jgi:lysophospholipase L1-like esterase